MSGLVEGKVALVTGAGTGIGRASAMAFAREGARAVVVADIDPEAGMETVALIEGAGGVASFVTTDVTDAASADAMVATTVERYGRLDCAHNNASISGSARGFTTVRASDWQRVLDVNLKGVWLCMRAEIRHFLARDGTAAIVNTASAASVIGTPGNPAYAASKHAVLGLTKTAALEYVRRDLRVNAVCPGVDCTAFEEIAEAAVWLASDRASFITGEGLLVAAGGVAR